MRILIPVVILLIVTNVMNVFGQEVSFSYDETNKKLNIRLAVKVINQDELQALTLKLFDKTDESKVPELVETRIIPKENIKNLNDEAIELSFNVTNTLTPGRKYEMRIYSTGILWTSFNIDTGLTVSFIERDDPICNGGIPMVFTGKISDSEEPDANNNGIGDETEIFWAGILNYFKQNDLHKNIIIEISMGKAETLQLESALLRKIPSELLRNESIDQVRLRQAALTGQVTLCMDPVNAPTQGVSNIRVKFKNAPFALSTEFIGEDFSWSGAPQIESSDALPDAPDDRKIERNLDLGFSFSSRVKRNAETNLRERESVGIVDIRLAPWVNLVNYKPDETVLRRWTPIFLNANVSTGKITESTLSLNRIIFGTQWEYRFVPSLSIERPTLKAQKKQKKCAGIADSANKKKCEDEIDNSSNFVDYYRLKFKGEHLSDRDFKQREIAANIEFQPVWAFLNKPRSARWFLDEDDITGEKITRYRTFGWEIIPKIGFQFGKTYSRRNPAEAVEATDLIKRLYGGIEMNFDITSRFTIKL